MKAATQETTKSLAEIERKLEELPLLPAVVGEAMSLKPDDNDYFDRVLHLAERDPPFAVRVLRAANSAAAGTVTPILSLRQAIMRLGTQQCAELVLSLPVTKVFVPRTAAQRTLWIHSIQVALMAQLFCHKLPAIRCNPEYGYLAGLLHDIGRFVQFDLASEDLNRVDDMHWESPRELLEAEHVLLNYDHSALGWYACKRWSLPNSLCEVVRRHHEPLPPPGQPTHDVIKVVQWADNLSVAFLTNAGLAAASPEEMIRQLRTDHASIGPPFDADSEVTWHRWIPEVFGESMRRARFLQLV